jgi:xylan 1,4-beta-xylosidase
VDTPATRYAEAARADWQERSARRRAERGRAPSLDPPGGLRATAGVAQVTLDWEPVEGAAGYLVHRASAPDGAWEPVDFGGNDVLAVPHPPFTDTTGSPGDPAWYAVASVSEVSVVGPRSQAVPATPEPPGEDAPGVTVVVRADEVVGPVHRPWRPMVGSEHLSHVLEPATTGGRPIGAELADALRTCHEELGVESVRAHGILCDDLGVYREVDGRPVHDFSGVDRVYDAVLDTGLRPVVELSFMPRDLAADPTKTVFAYEAVVSPPRDWDRWGDLVRALADHFVRRHGLDEVREHWSFEVWNEANLEAFWSGTTEEYLRLYEVSARAVKDVDPRLRVGGPSSAAAGWVGELLTHADESGAPVDFVSTHTYGCPPLDLRPVLARHGRAGVPLWWTEWGATPTHFNRVGDEAFAAAFLLRGMRSAAGRVEALSHWVASDHFEELGRPSALLHGGFGLLFVGNLRKPRFRGLQLLERLGDRELAVRLDGDGARGMVEAWAAVDGEGGVDVVVWNGTLDQSKAGGAAELDRSVTLVVGGLPADAYRLSVARVDAYHSNVAAVWRVLGAGADWPDEDQWAALRDADVLAEQDCGLVEVEGGEMTVELDLPMPGIVHVGVRPTDD